MYPLPPLYVHGACVVSHFPYVAREGVVGGGWCRLLGREGWFLLWGGGAGVRDWTPTCGHQNDQRIALIIRQNWGKTFWKQIVLPSQGGEFQR